MEIAFPPLHPLIVHAAVVLLPLAAIGALVIVVWGRARERYGSLVAVGAIAAAGAVIGARLSGEVLAGATTGTGTLGAHMFWGLIAPWPAAALAVAVAVSCSSPAAPEQRRLPAAQPDRPGLCCRPC